MAFTLLQDNRIIVGPRDWNPRFFEHFLQELGFDNQLPESPIFEPIPFGDSIKLVPTTFEQPPEINPIFEVLAGPFFKFDESGIHTAYYSIQSRDIETIKVALRQTVANSRWIKETTPIERDINGKTIVLDTDRESRAIYAQALSFVPDDYSSQWKFINGFITINKLDLQAIVAEVVSHVQTCFDWESAKVEEINSTTTIEGLKQIILE